MPKPRISLLLCITFVLSLMVVSDAKAFDSLHQVSHNRFLKKRAPVPQLPDPVNGAGANPPTLSEPTQSASTAAASIPVPSVPSSSASPSPSSASATSASGGLVGSVASALLPTTTSSSSSSSPSSSSSSSSSTSPTNTQPTPTIAQDSTAAPSMDTTPTQVVSPASGTVVYVTDTSSASASATPSSLSSSSSGITHTALIVLIVIAASVGGSIIIWTIIRKWKFGKSSSFDERMQPIDWQSSVDDGHAIPGMNRRHSNASSFHSGSGHGHGSGASVINPIPDHDFTAGPANLAPVGGYADLARGPSPQPMMQELARGPSFSRQYQSDQYGVPLHHGGYGTGY